MRNDLTRIACRRIWQPSDKDFAHRSKASCPVETLNPTANYLLWRRLIAQSCVRPEPFLSLSALAECRRVGELPNAITAACSLKSLGARGSTRQRSGALGHARELSVTLGSTRAGFWLAWVKSNAQPPGSQNSCQS